MGQPKKNQSRRLDPSPGGLKLPSFPSMQACSAACGIPLAYLKSAKKQGCSAFDQANRVHLGPLLKWMFRDGGGDDAQDWARELKKFQALTAKLEYEVAQNKLVSVDAVHAHVAGCVARAVALLRAKFITELPVKQDGMPAERIMALNTDALEKVQEILSQRGTYEP